MGEIKEKGGMDVGSYHFQLVVGGGENVTEGRFVYGYKDFNGLISFDDPPPRPGDGHLQYV